MPVQIDGGRIPPRWAEKLNIARATSISAYRSDSHVRIAFINNMPDAALEDTEMQFLELLEAAANRACVSVKLFSLPLLPRGDRGLQHVGNFYHGLDELWNSHFDALLMTGTEPLQRDLRQEPYWRALTEVLDWAERHTISTILSCLAAHAGVLHSDGVRRQPLPDKQFGVFDSAVADSTMTERHELVANAPLPMRFPHSRWNEVRAEDLRAAGYSVLTQSPEAGVDLFVKQKKKSLFVHFQGHPEYGTLTLLKEYRRDIKRFLRQERKTYPTLPQGYFDPASTKLLSEFQAKCQADPREEQLVHFPEAEIFKTLQNTWQQSAVVLYRNWIHLIASRKDNEKSAKASLAAVADNRREAAARP